ncbi:MAG: hypothetical protein V2J11_12110 [Desulfofustis sp.]|jgi:hypothetical protein|nr:hypothetical protein [Desulfofustis sp.]
MFRSIHLARAIERQLIVLRRSGKKGELAADQCQRILAELRENGEETAGIFLKRTKNGEYRMKNCVKYDLGGGYRLITVRYDDRLYVPFLGTHDDADSWLERRRREDFEPNEANYRFEPVDVDTTSDDDQTRQMSPDIEEPDLYEEHLRDRLDETTLREVFRGLCRNCGKTVHQG